MRFPHLDDSDRLGRGALGAALVVVLAVPAAIAAAPAGPLSAQARNVTETFDPGGYRGVRLDVKVGEVHVRGSSDDEILLAMRIECDWSPDDCRDRLEGIEVVPSDWDGDLYLGVEGLGFWGSRGLEIEIDLTLPARMAFTLELDVGEVEVGDLAGDVTLDVGIGEVDVTMDRSAVRTVTLDNGIGESRLRYPDGKQDVSGILGGREVFWDLGPGSHAVRVDLNIGEIRVTLR